MTVHDWLERRDPIPPAALRQRVRELVDAVAPAGDTTATLLAAAAAALQRLVREGSVDRAAALDLLAVDALVTYAFESAAEAPEGIPAHSAEAMARLSRAAP